MAQEFSRRWTLRRLVQAWHERALEHGVLLTTAIPLPMFSPSVSSVFLGASGFHPHATLHLHKGQGILFPSIPFFFLLFLLLQD